MLTDLKEEYRVNDLNFWHTPDNNKTYLVAYNLEADRDKQNKKGY